MAQLAVGEGCDGVVRKNEAILGGIAGKPFVLAELEEGSAISAATSSLLPREKAIAP
jgi:hypothetical protein